MTKGCRCWPLGKGLWLFLQAQVHKSSNRWKAQWGAKSKIITTSKNSKRDASFLILSQTTKVSACPSCWGVYKDYFLMLASPSLHQVQVWISTTSGAITNFLELTIVSWELHGQFLSQHGTQDDPTFLSRWRIRTKTWSSILCIIICMFTNVWPCPRCT